MLRVWAPIRNRGRREAELDEGLEEDTGGPRSCDGRSRFALTPSSIRAGVVATSRKARKSPTRGIPGLSRSLGFLPLALHRPPARILLSLLRRGILFALQPEAQPIDLALRGRQ